MNVRIVIGNIGRGRIGCACRATSFGTMPAFAWNCDRENCRRLITSIANSKFLSNLPLTVDVFFMTQSGL